MRSSALQKLLDKQKQNKFGVLITEQKWPELYGMISSGISKLDDILPPIIQNGKIVSFTLFVASLEPNNQNLRIVAQLMQQIPDSELQPFCNLFKDMVMGYPQYQKQVIEQIVRSFTLTDSSFYAETLILILRSTPHLSSTVSASIIKFFPQTSSVHQQQMRYLLNTLFVCKSSDDVNVAVLGRIFQHLVALDCELLVSSSPNGVTEIDEDVSDNFSPQLDLFIDHISNITPDIFALLLQLFDLYLIDLPKVAIVQYIFFYACSLSHSNAETFVGFLIAKLINMDLPKRSRANASLYLASLTVRASYIDDSFALTIMDYVADYANCYSNHVKNETPDQYRMSISQHSVYYYSIQCLSYILCWRWRSWSKRGINPNEKWNLSDLLCNNLRAIDVIDKNTADMLSTLGCLTLTTGVVVIERISVWFPFDPCVLESMEKRIRAFYVVWSNEEDPEIDNVDALLDNELSRVYERRDIEPNFSF
ncbi:RNA polymerase I-specific transcription initiation factor rrn3 [Histomonas meleagridis]|uniref:RNA polymerase I-specific transcription initiation factor rrn3 n=1 Tax=Histomonas meleagridis TaxID=135588 RepID=UPI0035595658|nr:RNA polymerase I-specific transcription initiation factor rrn3 [Histomonas meleagridis]KAH0805116.1 RNA polymerase I-specific transcription initiation factor rrn3 [Histomonas meleagridis]